MVFAARKTQWARPIPTITYSGILTSRLYEWKHANGCQRDVHIALLTTYLDRTALAYLNLLVGFCQSWDQSVKGLQYATSSRCRHGEDTDCVGAYHEACAAPLKVERPTKNTWTTTALILTCKLEASRGPKLAFWQWRTIFMHSLCTA